MAQLQLTHLRKSYGDIEILRGIDLQIADGEFVVFVGPSGCGKSTMLRCIAGLEEITSGELRIGSEVVNELPPSKRSIAMVFQSYALYPHMNVAQNMGFGLKLTGLNKTQIDESVERAAQILQITHLLDRKPKDLSGGQRQRVAIGRAIVRKPGVFLFDEPLSNLDAALRVQMRVELARLHRELKTTMIYVTHDQVEAMTLANRIVVFNDGRIEQVGTPLALYKTPANLFVAGFIGSPNMNFLPAKVVRSDGHLLWVELQDGVALEAAVEPTALAAGASVTLGIRPEHVEVVSAPGPNVMNATVVATEHMGDATYLYLSAPGLEQMVVRTDPDNALNSGDTAWLHVPTSRAHVFDSQGNAVPPRISP